mmetsp:Transcript_7226/g.9411  ORF Transcript_7226/g.9411 Transcript_7226/m.9411 type:complete len:105 (-) Transcript_7226:345-659(-)|eukprot:CAMPEP_0198150208 /NCGR_PEP_ID=MMETSP1443-20131203/49963_1 /TAXON_ID=186043 /ORGANISM="Entomoneis sp., Strain CCMP2396" /LENGTH=104 /DNA_ID=CAMNT_0043815457 /DNA_START=153 /DNA_END=467 /DNA_ORIENTATION=-
MTNNVDSNATSSEPFVEFKNEQQDRNLFYSIAWLLLVLLLVVPLASFLAPVWLFLQIIEPFLPVVREVNLLLEKFMTWPRLMGLAIYEGRATFPNPLEEKPTSS